MLIAVGGAGSITTAAASAMPKGKPTSNVELAGPTVKAGGNCRKGSSGCSNGKFTGNFFG
jgi:hypothetical protein